jgi:pimeloyl-ACP methyl ester carboxylesterase
MRRNFPAPAGRSRSGARVRRLARPGRLLRRAVRPLKLAAPAVVGHSFGGLLAAEIAAASRKSVGRLVLIDPVGLWLDDHPVQNWMILSSKSPAVVAVRRSRRRGSAKRFFEAPADARRARRGAGAIHLVAGLHRQIRLADRRPRLEQADPSHRGADPDRLGRLRRHYRAGLCAGVREEDSGGAG